MTYDKNGNILTLSRKGQTSAGVFGDLDVLTYSYTGMGNQIKAIGDTVTDVAGRGDFYDGTDGCSNKEYYYDRNGNTRLNLNKRMKTVYNHLNLPARISDTITPANKIEYVYTTAGEKLKQRLSTGTTLLYSGNFVYTLNGTPDNKAVKYILTQEGRVTNSAGTYTYEYFMKDHLVIQECHLMCLQQQQLLCSRMIIILSECFISLRRRQQVTIDTCTTARSFRITCLVELTSISVLPTLANRPVPCLKYFPCRLYRRWRAERQSRQQFLHR